MRRRLLAVGVLAALAVLAGCAGPLGGGGIDTSRADEEADYDWNASANATLTVQSDHVLAVYTVDGQETLEVYAFQRFNNERPLDPVAVRFRYPNGTVVGPEAMSFSTANSRTVIQLPAAEGQVALTRPKTGKRVRVPVVVEGSHEVILPENAQVKYFLLGRVAPAADERFEDADGRVHLRWDEVGRERLVVEYYLERDLLIFGAGFAVAAVLVVGGLAFFWLQLRTLRDRREQVAWEDDPDAP